MKILMTKVGNAPFIERDERILRNHFDLRVFQFAPRSWAFAWSAVKFWLWTFRFIWSADILFTRFAHYHAFLMGIAARCFRKKLVIVIGGSDAIWIPAYHYGVYDHWLSRRTTRWALRMAHLLLPNHESLIRGVNTYSDPEPRPEGLLCYTPDLQTPIVTVHNGYDHLYWRRPQGVPKEPIVLEVALTTEYKVFATKGLDDYIRTAGRLPEYQFILVGLEKRTLGQWWTEQVPANLQLIPRADKEELRTLYSRAQVFAHFSLTEGMPNVLCEAMLAECVPVGSSVNSIPDIIGDTGVIVHHRDPEEMASAIRTAMRLGTGPRARARIIERYPLERRDQELAAALRSLVRS